MAARQPADERAPAAGAGDTADWVAGRVEFRRWLPDSGFEAGARAFPEEMPVAVVVNDQDYAVMMASPADITDFAYGFLLAEGLIGSAAEIEAVDVRVRPEGLIAQTRLVGALPSAERRQRRLAGVSSCGLCGVETLRDAIKPMARMPDGPAFEAGAVMRAMAALRDAQPYNAVTGAMHAAAFAAPDGSLLCAREDVGRHTALDKLLGALLRQDTAPESGFVVMSSRCSYELIQKAAAFGVRLLCTVSAPTALAVRLAREANITLLSQARGNSFLVVAGGQRMEQMEALSDG